MPAPDRPYRLEWYGQDPDDTTAATDITGYVQSITKFTDVGTGEIVSAMVMLRSIEGDFVVSTDPPTISPWDTFRLTVWDDDFDSADAATYAHRHARYLIQDNRDPQKSDRGDYITLNLYGRERYLQKMPFPGHHYFAGFGDLARAVIRFYNANRGTGQPLLGESTIGDIAHTYGIFEFGDETSCYDALMEIARRLREPVAAGGAGIHYGLRFFDRSVERMGMYLVPEGRDTYIVVQSGSGVEVQAATPTITSYISAAEARAVERGNVQVVRGQPGSGTLPGNIARWRAYLEEFNNLPLWGASAYRDGAWVRHEGRAYQAGADAASTDEPGTTGSEWAAKGIWEYMGVSSFQISPWTDGKSTVWKNWGSAGTGFAFPDGNLVIRDAQSWRDWADFRVNALADIPASRQYPAMTGESRLYRGMRLLLDSSLGTLVSPFTGNDKFGKSYSNALVSLDRDGDWIVIREPQQFDEVAVTYEGKVYEWNLPLGTSLPRRNRSTSTTNLAWRDMTVVPLGNDCFHHPSLMENVPSLLVEYDGTDISLGEQAAYLALSDSRKDTLFGTSAIRIKYTTTPTLPIFGAAQVMLRKAADAAVSLWDAAESFLFGDDTEKTFTADEEAALDDHSLYNNLGWWATIFQAPFPGGTEGGISEDVGELYGGTTDSKVPLLDLQNLNFTPTGKSGYGHPDSDSLGPLGGISFLINLDITGFDFKAIEGGIPMAALIEDALSNVHILRWKLRLQGQTQYVRLPFSAFTVYRARTQPAFLLRTQLTILRNADLNVQNTLDRRLIKRITIRCEHIYDDRGAFSPLTWETFLRDATAYVAGTEIAYDGTIDMVAFFKAPVAIADNSAESGARFLMAPIKEYRQVSNVEQLRKIATAELDVSRHQPDNMTIRLTGRADIKSEQAVYVEDPDLIPASETDNGNPHSRRLIVRSVVYSVSADAESGLITTLSLFRQLAT